MQTYSPRDPVREYIAGTLPHADLRLMIETLGPNTPWARERQGPWSQLEWLVHDVGTQLRYLRAELRAIATRQVQEPELHPIPEPTERQLAEREADLEAQRQTQADLLRVMQRGAGTTEE